MPDLYDMSLLSAQDSFVNQILVINYWTEGILFGGLIVVFALIIFVGTKMANQETTVSLIYSSFFGALASIIGWLFRYNGEPAVLTLIPFMFIFILGASLVVRLMKGSLKQTD